MILRILTMALGLTGAAGGSQFPEYAQQYVQRLGGAVDELSKVVGDFDASAAAEGLNRAEALEAMTGSAFVDRRRADMERTIARYDRLRADLTALERAGPFMRAYHGTRLTDTEIAASVWKAYRPAMPLSFEGAVFAGSGFVLAALGFGMLCWFIQGLMPRRRTRPADPA